MKAKRYFFLLPMLIALPVWKFWPTENARPTASSPKPNALQTTAMPKLSSGMVVEVPKSAPVPASTSSTGSETAPVAQPSQAELHAELNAEIDDMINCLQSGDDVGFFKNYLLPKVINKMQESPGGFEGEMEQRQQDSHYSAHMQNVVDALRRLKELTPDFGVNGHPGDPYNYASYTLDPPPPDGLDLMQFSRVNGRWYINF